ncbi:ABC transporter permease subunit [Cryptosporangium aurantiacum]|uniref:Branched-chain amino acid transport system permease protein n=1 Tax=Cryptosporangium aurantiacum TaxID=134849 RepID=A0A1M7PI83_9ACTN|nr:ABC transporter permease [Cryptosporangium aurantiacum]SHN16755.1 branched-chain amino acid transport system permease protein [Cryptosporangium aurantiacum]
MVPYLLAGLALGAIYALAAAGLVVTYISTGVLNFAFGSMAFFLARLFYWLDTQQGWDTLPAALVTLGLAAPILSVGLYVLVFRHLRDRSTLIKLVATIGLSVALPPLANLLFGDEAIAAAPGLSPQPVPVYTVLGTALSLDQLITYAILLAVVVVGTVVLRRTDVGLKIRAMVDSEALTRSMGVDTGRLAVGVWAVSGVLAGLAGVLIAPTAGLTLGSMTLLMAIAFAAVVAARLRSLPIAVLAALTLGVVTDVIQMWLPADSTVTAAIVAGVPFAFMTAFLLYFLARGGAVGQEVAAGGALDRAIRVDATDGPPSTAGTGHRPMAQSLLVSAIVVLLVLLPALTTGYWLGLVAQSCALAVAFLSITLVTGEGGMIWLCQIGFAGAAAILAAQLATAAGMDPLLAVLVAAAVMAPVGVLVGALTIRLGELYVALVTLSLGLLAQTQVFTRDRFYQYGAGVTLERPAFLAQDRTFAYLAIAVFAVVAFLTINLRRSTTGLAISAVRWSEPAARTLGLDVLRTKSVLAGFAAFVAGLGGGLLALYNQAAVPDNFETFTGLVWVAVLVTVGARSVLAAAGAALLFAVLPGVVATYLPTHWGSLPPLLFGLGALGVAIHPEGVVVAQGRQLVGLFSRRRPDEPDPQPSAPATPAPVGGVR